MSPMLVRLTFLHNILKTGVVFQILEVLAAMVFQGSRPEARNWSRGLGAAAGELVESVLSLGSPRNARSDSQTANFWNFNFTEFK